jgi:amino-acid N-acetyltransferase
MPELRLAQSTDLPAILALLEASGLPHRDLTAVSAIVHLAEWRGQLVGVAGMQLAGSVALLRSVAVATNFRGCGIARRLVDLCESSSMTNGISAFYLIANDAAALNFFSHIGYPRSNAASSLRHCLRCLNLVTFVRNLAPACGRLSPAISPRNLP